MKIKFTVFSALLLLVSLLVSSAYGETSEITAGTFTLRNGIKLGMSMDEVIGVEGKEPDASMADACVYRNQSVADLPADLFFSFSDGKLKSITYDFLSEYNQFSSYSKDFETIKTALIEKYGPPFADETEINGNQYSSSLEDYVKAFKAGDISYRVGWKFDGLLFLLSLGKSNGDIVLRLTYSSYGDESSDQSFSSTDGL